MLNWFKKKEPTQKKAQEALGYVVMEPKPEPKPEPKTDNFSIDRHIETSKELVSILTNRLESIQIEMQVDDDGTSAEIEMLLRRVDVLRDEVAKRRQFREKQCEEINTLITNYQNQVAFLEGKKENPPKAKPQQRKRKPVEVAS